MTRSKSPTTIYLFYDLGHNGKTSHPVVTTFSAIVLKRSHPRSANNADGSSVLTTALENITLVLHAEMPVDSFDHHRVIDLISTRVSELAIHIC
jgi:hypothetical protein